MAARFSAGATAVPPAYVQSSEVGFLSSLSVDRSLARYDLAGSVAHVAALEAAGLLPPSEASALTAALRSIAREIEGGSFRWRVELEDVHTNIESRLAELLGPTGRKLQTGRSRNDQVAVDERLYLRAAVQGLATGLLRVQKVLLDEGASAASTPMPGYTHLQRAQPVSVGHHLLAHFWRFDRDLDRLFATVERSDRCPLGAGALAGSGLGLDVEATARRLGFAAPCENSLDAVSDRDPLAELLFDLALLSVHASSLGEELVLFASQEFGFLLPSEALGSGSSLMPQKRNPDVAELIRGRAGRAVGDLVALLTTLKGLPLAYNRDLQEDKAPVLDAVATLEASLGALARVLSALRWDSSRLAAASSDPGLYASDLAERLVRDGVPFRDAHEAVRTALLGSPAGPHRAPLVVRSPSTAVTFELSPDPVAALGRRTSLGSPGPGPIARQLELARAALAARQSSLSSLARKVELVEELLNEGKR